MVRDRRGRGGARCPREVELARARGRRRRCRAASPVSSARWVVLPPTPAQASRMRSPGAAPPSSPDQLRADVLHGTSAAWNDALLVELRRRRARAAPRPRSARRDLGVGPLGRERARQRRRASCAQARRARDRERRRFMRRGGERRAASVGRGPATSASTIQRGMRVHRPRAALERRRRAAAAPRRSRACAARALAKPADLGARGRRTASTASSTAAWAGTRRGTGVW